MAPFETKQDIVIEIKKPHQKSNKKFSKALEILLKAFNKRILSPKSYRKEISPYLSEREFEDQSKERVESLLLKLHREMCQKWLGLSKASSDFKLDGKIFINPQTGKALTKAEWKIIKNNITRAFGSIYGKEETRVVRTAMALGKILKKMGTKAAVSTPLKEIRLTSTIVAKELTDLPYRAALQFAEERVGEDIVELTERQYNKIHHTLLNAIQDHNTPKQLESKLFDNFADWNRDWRRIAETEIGTSVNNGQLITELQMTPSGEYTYVQGISSAGACGFCATKVDGKIFVMLNEPPTEGGEEIRIGDKIYTALWPGKNNVGRNRKDWWVSVIQHPHTYSKDTEVLTDSGWKYFYHLNPEDKIMAINPNTKEIDFVSYIGFVKHYQKKMVRLHGRNFDLMVTPEHRQLYSSQKTGNFIEKSISEIIKLKSFSLPRAVGNWLKPSKIIQIGKYSLDETMYARLWAWFLSDGSVSLRENDSLQVNLYQKDQTNVCYDLKEFYSNNYIVGWVKEIFRPFVKVYCDSKYIPKDVKNLSADALKEFIIAYSKADGHNRKGKKLSYKSFQSKSGLRNDETVLYTTSKRLASDLGEIIVKAGYIPSYFIQEPSGKLINFPNGKYKTKKNVYVIRVCKSKYRRFNASMKVGKIDTIEYNDFAYDVELEKWHHLLVRRNGKVAWSGNCRCSWVRYEPGFEEADALLRDAIAEAEKKAKEHTIPEYLG